MLFALQVPPVQRPGLSRSCHQLRGTSFFIWKYVLILQLQCIHMEKAFFHTRKTFKAAGWFKKQITSEKWEKKQHFLTFVVRVINGPTLKVLIRFLIVLKYRSTEEILLHHFYSFLCHYWQKIYISEELECSMNEKLEASLATSWYIFMKNHKCQPRRHI